MGVPLFENELSAATSLTTTANFDFLIYSTSALDAVNEMLSVIGEQPVNSLVQSTPTVFMGMQLLARATRRVQANGWYWNTEFDVKVELDSQGRFPVPTNWIRFWPDPGAYTGKRLVARGGFVYDLVKRTNVITGIAQLDVNAVFFLNWDDIPENARAAITLRAARRFHAIVVGDERRQQWLKEDEERAWLEIERDDSEWAGYSVFAGGAARMAVARGRVPRGNDGGILPAVPPGVAL